MMTYRTVQLSSCVSAQGELVQVLGNGEILIRDGQTIYRGRPVEFSEPPVSGSAGSCLSVNSDASHLL